MTSLPIIERSCGTCSACCTVLGVAELDKKPCVRCDYLAPKGCGVYQDRPESCREYQCLWLKGGIEGDERRRPDQLGLIFDIGGGTDRCPLIFVVAWETHPESADRDNVRHFLKKLGQKFLVVVRRYGTHKTVLCGPQSLVEEFQELVVQYGSVDEI